MKVLFVSALFPFPLSSGGHVRIFNLIKHLGAKHEITLFAYIRSEAERRYIPQLEKFCKSVHVFYRGTAWQPKYVLRAATSSLPFLMATYENRALSDAITQATGTQTYDLVHAEPFYVSHVIPKSATVPLVVTEHNIEYDVYGSYAKRFRLMPILYQVMMLDTLKLKAKEQRIWRQAKRIICVSQGDRQVVSAAAKRSDIDLVPNGVDTGYYAYHTRAIERERPKFLFVGNFLWLPNREALDRILTSIWPALHRKWPGAVFTIVGPNMSQKDRSQAMRLGLEVLGWVDDIRSVYARSSLLLAPMGIGGGTKFKILEAMASGLPVVTSKAGASGLAVADGINILLAQTPEEYVGKCEKIIQSADARNTLTGKARKLVETNYSWDSLAQNLSNIWESTV